MFAQKTILLLADSNPADRIWVITEDIAEAEVQATVPATEGANALDAGGSV